jgi:DNA-directed RNA polymerase subunit L
MENTRISMNGFRLDCEFKNVPVAFVNALRRILLAEIPTVVFRDVVITENTTSLVHEMMRLRVEMMPVNVRPDEIGVIRDTKIGLRLDPSPDSRVVMSTDFTVNGTRQDVILQDRDLGKPLYFMTVRPNETVRLEASLGTSTLAHHGGASQVCVSTYKYHIDPTLAQLERDRVIAENGDVATFDNHDIQRCWSRDANGRPNWFDFAIESIGVIPARDLLKTAIDVLKVKINKVDKAEIAKDESGAHVVEIADESYTLGAMMHSLIYTAGPPSVTDVRFTAGHPLTPKMVVRFVTDMPAKDVVDRFKKDALDLCESILRSV